MRTTQQQHNDTTNVSSNPAPESSTKSTETEEVEDCHTSHYEEDKKRHVRKKRRMNNNTSKEEESSSSSSCYSSNSGSSGEDDEESSSGEEEELRQKEIKRSTTNNSQQSPRGWRVKLYRLNSDGSWDDCGTGRIVCLHHNDDNTSTAAQDDSSSHHDVGEPMLCMHAEVPNNNNTTLNNKPPKVLLRTRVLLSDVYQRQGDNIITWCEPFFSSSLPCGGDTHESDYAGDDPQPAGVDLALSFQDNAGCLDIWKQITNIQKKAQDLTRSTRGGRPETSASRSSANLHDGDDDEHFEGSEQPQHNTATHCGENVCHADSNGEGASRMGRGGSVSEVAHAVAAAHHADLQQQQQNNIWVNVASSDATQQHLDSSPGLSTSITFEMDEADLHQSRCLTKSSSTSFYDGATGKGSSNALNAMIEDHDNQTANVKLPNPPTLENLGEIADSIAAAQQHQHESISSFVARDECAYLRALLSLFPRFETNDDYRALATLAACTKTILLFNDPSVIETVVTDGQIFEDVCSALEYDPDLRDKANHRWFIRERARFRTVVLMKDDELIDTIHRSFRVAYLRDTLLRPTMDESSLSTLASLLAFTHADVVKGVMCTQSILQKDHSPYNQAQKLNDSYLVQVLRMLGKEVKEIRKMEWKIMEQPGNSDADTSDTVSLPPGSPTSVNEEETDHNKEPEMQAQSTIISAQGSRSASSTWKQHLSPQDSSLSSRKIRRRGCLSFLRELFNMVRMSLQQSDKDDFYTMIVFMDVDIDGDVVPFNNQPNRSDLNEANDCATKNANDPKSVPTGEQNTVNLLSLLGAMLSDPNTDVTERSACLEILSAIAMHDPSLIRRHCLNDFATAKEDNEFGKKGNYYSPPGRPEPNERRQVIFSCPPSDLLFSLLFVMAVETDAGVLLQTSEIMRIILDTEMMGDHGPLGGGMTDNEDELIGGGSGSGSMLSRLHAPGGGRRSEQNSFLSMFYEHYIQWLVAPFQYFILFVVTALPFSSKLLGGHASGTTTQSQFLHKMHHAFKTRLGRRTGLLRPVSCCAIRTSFAVELLSFCVRAHCYRMKFYMLRSSVLGSVLKLLSPKSRLPNISGDRCLKLAVLRFLRSILSVKDEFYHRHIVQLNLLEPVFDAFRANPVGDNLVSSAIIEMCDFIKSENIKSLLEDIVTKHLFEHSSQSFTKRSSGKLLPSLEDVATPYVTTLTQLREKYEENIAVRGDKVNLDISQQNLSTNAGHSLDSVPDRGPRIVMNEKALEDQRKFLETDEEESYFNDDDDNEETRYDQQNGPTSPVAANHSSTLIVDDDLASQENEMRRARQYLGLSTPVVQQDHSFEEKEENKDVCFPFVVEAGDDGQNVRDDEDCAAATKNLAKVVSATGNAGDVFRVVSEEGVNSAENEGPNE